MDYVQTRARGRVPVLRVTGDVDLGSVAAWRPRLDELVNDASPVIVVDLAGVHFLDSSGLRALDDVRSRVQARGGALALACPQERLLRLFEITGLDDRFVIESTPERAAQSAKAAGRG